MYNNNGAPMLYHHPLPHHNHHNTMSPQEPSPDVSDPENDAKRKRASSSSSPEPFNDERGDDFSGPSAGLSDVRGKDMEEKMRLKKIRKRDAVRRFALTLALTPNP